MLRGQHWKKIENWKFWMQSYQPSIFRLPVLDPSFLESLQDGDELQAVTDDDQSLMDWRSGQRLNFLKHVLKQPRTSWVQNWSTNTSVVLYYKYNSSRSMDFSHKPILESIHQLQPLQIKTASNLINQNQSNKSTCQNQTKPVKSKIISNTMNQSRKPTNERMKSNSIEGWHDLFNQLSPWCPTSWPSCRTASPIEGPWRYFAQSDLRASHLWFLAAVWHCVTASRWHPLLLKCPGQVSIQTCAHITPKYHHENLQVNSTCKVFESTSSWWIETVIFEVPDGPLDSTQLIMINGD